MNRNFIIREEDIEIIGHIAAIQDLFNRRYDNIFPGIIYDNWNIMDHQDEELKHVLNMSFEEYEVKTNPINDDCLEGLQTSEIVDPQKEQCLICISDYIKGEQVTTLPCNHFFHSNCINTWLRSQSLCPCCRKKVE
jgi:hypothetical protein